MNTVITICTFGLISIIFIILIILEIITINNRKKERPIDNNIYRIFKISHDNRSYNVIKSYNYNPLYGYKRWMLYFGVEFCSNKTLDELKEICTELNTNHKRKAHYNKLDSIASYNKGTMI